MIAKKTTLAMAMLLMLPAAGLAAATDVNLIFVTASTQNSGGNCRPDWGARQATVTLLPTFSTLRTGVNVGNACQAYSWQQGSALWVNVYTYSLSGYDYVLFEWHEEDGAYANYCIFAGYSSFTPGPNNNRFFSTGCVLDIGPGFLLPQLP